MISASVVRGATTYNLEAKVGRSGMLDEVRFVRHGRSGRFMYTEGVRFVLDEHAPGSAMSMDHWLMSLDDEDVPADRFEASYAFQTEKLRSHLAALERYGAHLDELIALARDLSDARDVRTSADLSPWLERYADIVGGVQP